MSDVQITGLAALDRKLANLPRKTERKVVKQSIKKSAAVIQNEIVARTPVDTGTLKREMAKKRNIRTLKKRRDGSLGMRIASPKREALGIDEDDKFYYPSAVEFGTSELPGQHVMRQATEAKKEEYLRQLSQEMGAGIEAEAKKSGMSA